MARPANLDCKKKESVGSAYAAAVDGLAPVTQEQWPFMGSGV